MSVSSAAGGSTGGGREPPRSSYRRSGAIARRSTILLSGTAALALSITQPARAISINDQAALDAGGITNYYGSTNRFFNVVSLFGPGVPGTGLFQPGVPGGHLARLILYRFVNQFTDDPDGSSLLRSYYTRHPVYIVRANRRQQRSKFSRHNELLPSYGFRAPGRLSAVAVISLSRPITSIRPVVLSGNVPAALAHGVWMQPHGAMRRIGFRTPTG